MPEIRERKTRRKSEIKSRPWGDRAKKVYIQKLAKRSRDSGKEEAPNEYASEVTTETANEAVHTLLQIPRSASAPLPKSQARSGVDTEESVPLSPKRLVIRTEELGSKCVRTDHGALLGIKVKGKSAPKQKQSIAPKLRSTAVASKPDAIRAAAAARQTISHRATELGRKKFIQDARKMVFTQTKRTAADLLKKAGSAVIKAMRSAIGMVAGLLGGTGLIAVFCVIMVIGVIAASPFGILFANEPRQGTLTLSEAVAQINGEYIAHLEELQQGEYDHIMIQGTSPDWRNVIAVFACKTAAAADGIDVAGFDEVRVALLRTVFWDMCSISVTIEVFEHPDSDPEDDVNDSRTERILNITVSSKTVDEMRTAYGFTQLQNETLDELLQTEVLNSLLGNLSISQEDALAVLQNLPAGLSPERRRVVEQALSLVGKVNYFWGGKSLVLGWDSRWGQIELVWAAGSKTTGTYRPYGLDCSGFVDWVFYNVSGGTYVIGHGGGAASQHRYCTNISWSEAQPGDLVFYPEDDHVGIVGGRDSSGNLLVIHCASGSNNVVITGISGFTTIARPQYYSE